MNERLGLEEYSQFILENLPKTIINKNYIDDNYDFIHEILFKFWEDYDTSVIEPISLMKHIKLLSTFFSILFHHQPDVTLPEDTL